MKRSQLIASMLVTFVFAIGAMMTAPLCEPALASDGALAVGAFSDSGDSPNLEIQATKYKIWVAGKQVTSANAKDVLGNGTVSFNAKTHTLTLKNAKITKPFTAKYKTSNGKNTIKIPSKGA